VWVVLLEPGLQDAELEQAVAVQLVAATNLQEGMPANNSNSVMNTNAPV
jgi:hypothetical protein